MRGFIVSGAAVICGCCESQTVTGSTAMSVVPFTNSTAYREKQCWTNVETSCTYQQQRCTRHPVHRHHPSTRAFHSHARLTRSLFLHPAAAARLPPRFDHVLHYWFRSSAQLVSCWLAQLRHSSSRLMSTHTFPVGGPTVTLNSGHSIPLLGFGTWVRACSSTGHFATLPPSDPAWPRAAAAAVFGCLPLSPAPALLPRHTGPVRSSLPSFPSLPTVPALLCC